MVFLPTVNRGRNIIPVYEAPVPTNTKETQTSPRGIYKYSVITFRHKVVDLRRKTIKN